MWDIGTDSPPTCECVDSDNYDSLVEEAKELGEDCIPFTADDDENNVGDDDCPINYTYDYATCSCLSMNSPELCPESPNYCLFSGYILGQPECKCISDKEYLDQVDKASELGPDCIAGTFDDDDNNIGNDDCPSGYSYDFTICNCVTYEDSTCPIGE